MNKVTILVIAFFAALVNFSFNDKDAPYFDLYNNKISQFENEQEELIKLVEAQPDVIHSSNLDLIRKEIRESRLKLKSIDFWLRYLEPILYKRINSPLPVEWETEVFEKFEAPYKREGFGLTLAEQYLDEPDPKKTELLKLLYESRFAISGFQSDSIRSMLKRPDHLFFANRLYLLNLSAIYTTGFECPDPENILPELSAMIVSVKEIYQSFNNSFPTKAFPGEYLDLHTRMEEFVLSQPKDPNDFNHFVFIKDYVNPLYAINQKLIRAYEVYSRSYNDYSLNDANNSIFDKDLYTGQNRKGIYIRVDDEATLKEIKTIGKLLFYDPILSSNGKRSCASCHKPTEYFTDTTVTSHLTYDKQGQLLRNTPSLINVVYNHLLMMDGKHISLQDQAKDVISNHLEMGLELEKVIGNVMSCDVYEKAFKKFRKLTPQYPELSVDHIVSAITLFYSDFSDQAAPFDRAMNKKATLDEESIKGFNLFMGKTGCATCHFVPNFNGVKPPYIGSEFEVLGVPVNKDSDELDKDSGRYKINPAGEMLHAFRTGSLRNSSFTKPYMHHGMYATMDDVIDFYDAGGGQGKKIVISNQTLPADSLRLTKEEKHALKKFLQTLDEDIIFPAPPSKLPESRLEIYRGRKIGGEY